MRPAGICSSRRTTRRPCRPPSTRTGSRQCPTRCCWTPMELYSTRTWERWTYWSCDGPSWQTFLRTTKASTDTGKTAWPRTNTRNRAEDENQEPAKQVSQSKAAAGNPLDRAARSPVATRHTHRYTERALCLEVLSRKVIPAYYKAPQLGFSRR